MDRYAVITVDRKTGKPDLYAVYNGVDAATRAYARAEEETDQNCIAVVAPL
jgi:hypothetical protein